MYWTFNIRKEESVDKVAVFSELAQKFDLISFEELIPDMNEIFIQTVQKINSK